MVGSEDGSLYKCSTAYASEYLQVGRGQGGELLQEGQGKIGRLAVVRGACADGHTALGTARS